MAKLPAFQFYTGDWLKDPELSMCSPATRGVWIDWIARMHELNRCGQLTGSVSQLARLGRCTLPEAQIALDELRATNAADVTVRHQIVTLTNRRMAAEFRRRNSSRERKVRQRSRGDPAPGDDVTQKSRAPSSDSSSSSEDVYGQTISELTSVVRRPPPPGPSESGESDQSDQMDFYLLAPDAAAVGRTVRIGSRNTRQLIARAVILSRTKFSQNWLWDAVEGVKQTKNRNPAGYFRTCLQQSSEMTKAAFDDLLKATRVPRQFYTVWDEFTKQQAESQQQRKAR